MNVYTRRMDVVVFPRWDWWRVFRSASSGMLGESEPTLPIEDQSERLDAASPLCYTAYLTLVSFGSVPMRRSEVLRWARSEKLQPASLRDLMAIPSAHPNFFRQLGYDHWVLEPTQRLSDYMDILGDRWAQTALSLIGLAPGPDGSSKAIYSIKCIDHGDFDFFNYWACVDTIQEEDPTFISEYNCYPELPEGRLWFVFASHTTTVQSARMVQMKYQKKIVVFANSRKTTGRCIAGREWHDGAPGEWVRPVSTRTTHEISEEERRYEDGRDPQLLDVVLVPCESHQPLPHQRENHIIDPRFYWAHQGRLPWKDISGWLDQPNTLWGTGQGSYAGLNNRVAIGQENGSSLYLIAVERLKLLVGRKAPEYPDSKRGVRGEFSYRGTAYRMDVTDPAIERKYLGQADGQYDIVRPFLCVSLSDPFQGHFYKIIAAVLYAGQPK